MVEIDFESELNPAQLEAVRSKDGAYLVIAGAGSGKTRTLVYRVAYLVNSGVDPKSILLLTFTRKSAEEMLVRASKLLDARCKRVDGGTFHSFCAGVLRKHAKLIGFKNNFTILDQTDSEGIVKLMRDAGGYGAGEKRFPKSRTIHEIISKVVNRYMVVKDVVSEEYPHFLDFVEDIRAIGSRYKKYKKENNLMDYDDLLVWTRELLENNPKTLEKLSRKYKYVMVDEYQDTNKIQAQIVCLLASEHGNLMVVGDDCQSIYRFRGADWHNIMQLPEIFPNVKIFTLEENYRSTQPILNFTNKIVEDMDKKYEKRLYTNFKGGKRPTYKKFQDAYVEAEYVVDEILELREQGVDLDKIAVLYRTLWAANILEEELNVRNIPYVKRGGLKFLERAHVKDVISHLDVAINLENTWHWNRILQIFEGVGPVKAEKMINKIKEDGVEALIKPPNALRGHLGDLKRLYSLIKYIQESHKNVVDPVHKTIKYYIPHIKRLYDNYPDRLPDLESLESMAQRFRSLENYLSNLALEPPNVAMHKPKTKEENPLVLTTIHQAKGLEWHTVFLIQLNDGQLPHAYSLSNKEELEEERRIFYVACTRAQKNLVLTRPNMTSSFYAGTTIMKESRFLKGMKKYVKTPKKRVSRVKEEPVEETTEKIKLKDRIMQFFKPANEF